MNLDIKVVGGSRAEDYNTQRDNERWPAAACNVTSYVMAATRAGWKMPHEPGEDPADVFMQRMRSPELYERMRARYPWTYRTERQADGSVRVVDRYAPSEIHDLLAEEFNAIMGMELARFLGSCQMQDIAWALFRGAGVVVSGDFPYKGRQIGHVVHLQAIVTTQPDLWSIEHKKQVETQYIREFRIDDPFGDWRTGYSERNGYGVPMSVTEFYDIMKRGTAGGFWAHIIQPKARKEAA